MMQKFILQLNVRTRKLLLKSVCIKYNFCQSKLKHSAFIFSEKFNLGQYNFSFISIYRRFPGFTIVSSPVLPNMGCIYMYGIAFFAVIVFGYALYSFITDELKRRKLERWNNLQKDEIVLHGYPRSKSLPSASPYPLKVETYLRLAGLKYTFDSKDMFGPKGKTPWISINGKHIGDSEFIIEFLNKKFEKDLSVNCEEKDLANARIIRVMLEEFFMWAIGLERLVYGDNKRLRKVLGDKLPTLFLMYFRRTLKKRAYDQGIGRHTQKEVTQLMTQNLKSVSIALGNKNYFGGNELCQEDCGIFGVLAQCLWGAPDSPYEELMNNECKNLKEYCLRVKERVWADWDDMQCK